MPLLTALLSLTPGALAESWTTGDMLDYISAGDTLTYEFELTSPDEGELEIKYGLWNSPDVPMEVRLNSTVLGTITATQGYSSPGPQYETWDVSGLLVSGLNLIEVEATSGGDAVIGRIDLEYTVIVDADLDGYFEDDCDDEDESVYPGAEEVLDDGVDQDCDGFDSVTCYADLDGDGYAGPSTVIGQGDCSAEGLFEAVDDCDDDDDSVYPGAEDLPDDGVDQNCSGFDSMTCWLDNDGDGWGGDASVVLDDALCEDYLMSDRTGDCADQDAEIHPDAIDLPDDGIDQDCDGTDAVSETEPSDSGMDDSGLDDSEVEEGEGTGADDDKGCRSAASSSVTGLGLLLSFLLLGRRRRQLS